jgi:hypothetical protein
MATILPASNPVAGSNPSGTGASVNYVGNHAYAYSGIVTVGTNYTSLLEFSTGANYITSNIQFYSASITGADINMKVSLNSEAIIESAYNQQGQLDPVGYEGHIVLIPPYSSVKIEMKVVSGTSELSTTLSGRVYA